MDTETEGQDSLTTLEALLNYHFQDKHLLTQALIHTTFAYESQEEDLSDNQRLEFLGDSILGMVVAEYFYRQYPNASEEELTRRRSLIVNRNNLAKKAKELSLGKYLYLGKGEGKLGGRDNATNLSCALEAIIAAIYLDGGFEEVKEFIVRTIIS